MDSLKLHKTFTTDQKLVIQTCQFDMYFIINNYKSIQNKKMQK